MTIERASELVKALRRAGKRSESIDLFAHFVDYFDIQDVRQFAIWCGYPIAVGVVEDE